MTDIVERLRDRNVCSREHNFCRNEWRMEIAADEIERLREALHVIEAYSDCHENARNIARAALGEVKPLEDRWDNE